MIKFYLKANKDLKEKNNNLQYNVRCFISQLSDLRALVKVVDVENDENMENL